MLITGPRTDLAAPAAPVPAPARETNCFDLLRLFAALCVVVQHSVAHLHRAFLWFHPGSQLWFFDGVPLFFIISGMLVYRSCERCLETGRPVRQFYLNRFLRIAPAIYAYVLVTPILLLLTGAIAWHALATRPFWAWFGSTVALVPVYNPSTFRGIGIGVLNGSLWTIPTECGFYLFVPALVLLERQRGFRALLQCLAALTLAGLLIEWGLERLAPGSLEARLYNVTFVPYLAFFGLGIFWLRAWSRVPQRGGLALLCAALYALAKGADYTYGLGPLWKLLAGIPLSYVVVWLAYRAPRWLAAITRRGDLSYGVYIWHMVIVNVLLFTVGSRLLAALPGSSPHFVVLAITLVVAGVSWRFIERPALRLKPFTTRPADPMPAVESAPPRESFPAREAA